MAIFKKKHKRDGIERYYIRFTKQDGRRKVEQAGTTRKQAEKLLKKRLGEVASDTYVDPREVGKSTGTTFNEFADRFMKEYATRCRSDHYQDRLKRARKTFGKRMLKDIRRADIDRYTLDRTLEKASPSTIRKDLAALVTLFKKAVEWGVLDASPAVGLRKPQEPKPKTRYLSRDEWGRVEQAAPPWLRPMLQFAVATGMRLGEIALLRWEDVDRHAGIVHVPENTKTGTRPVPLNSSARDVLVTISRVRHLRSRFVFVDGDGGDYTSAQRRNRISAVTRSVMRDADVYDASFHTLRHTAAAWMVQAGVPLYEVQKILGHSTPLMTQRYAHLQPEHLKGAVNALDAAIRGVPANQTATCPDAAVAAASPGLSKFLNTQ